MLMFAAMSGNEKAFGLQFWISIRDMKTRVCAVSGKSLTNGVK